ncbi:MAG: LysM peptidoglycan-binding domain-containing protein [Nitrospinae bacterium]|nr:LysM peptidoglycan-binding domain-containing protein [Nitrospinota bacterium]
MKKTFLIFLSFLFFISISRPALSNTGDVSEENLEQDDSAFLEESEDSTETIPAEDDSKLIEELSTPDANLFHVPSSLQTNVNFWKRIYSEFTTNQVVVHDKDNLNVIYDVVDVGGGGYGNKMRRGKVNEVRRKYRAILTNIHNKLKKGGLLIGEEIEVYRKFDGIDNPNKFIIAAGNLRCQLGQKDRFIEGLKRSGRYIEKMKEIFRGYNLPEELTALPHVESSFNYEAYSSVGAAGVWQFMRSTGRLFMTINYVVDERRDPIFSTVAAAKLLKRNYEELGSWPLAIIAYNHGLSGMKRAKERMGEDVTDVINGYRSRMFGFASKNFFCEFLAALDVSRNYKKYFGDIEFEKPVEYNVVKVESYLDIAGISKHMGLNKDEIKYLNPALRPPVFVSRRFIPKGFELKIPRGRSFDIGNMYASLPKNMINQPQKHSSWHTVEYGDTLTTIAQRNNITVSAIMDINELDNINRIYPGQTLKLPELAYGKDAARGEANTQYQKSARIPIKSDAGEMKLISKERNLVKSTSETNKENMHLSAESKIKSLTPSTGFQRAAYEVALPEGFNSKKITFGYINVETDETIGHYADWSGVSVQRLKDVNGLRRRAGLRIGQRIKIPFISAAKDEFEEKRAEYHMAIQEDFFSNYKVDGTTSYEIRRGETIWKLCEENEIPLWLLKRYNPQKNFQRLARGEPLVLPVISKIN